LVFAKQDGTVRYGQINELLVIAIFASGAGFGWNLYVASASIKFLQNLLGRNPVKSHALGNFWISQNALYFFAHRSGG